MKKQGYISIEGARANNLKNISVKIPHGKLTVISGLSGSGKSSLAFETLFAEGQRRFAQSLSSFARQFLGRMSKPAVDKIEGIPPAIAIEQKVNTRNPRSTVGTTTEIYDYLRLLFARIGRTYSPVSGKEVKCENVADVIDYITKFRNHTENNLTAYILAYVNWEANPHKIETLLSIKDSGYSRMFYQGEMVRIDNVIKEVVKYTQEPIYILTDRFVITPNNSEKQHSEDEITRLQDSIESTFNQGGGYVTVAIEDKHSGDITYRNFSNIFEADGIKFQKPTELMFSFNNPLGACPECGGYGSVFGIDENLVVPNASLSVYEGAIACWRGEVMGSFLKDLIYAAPKFNFPIHRPYAELTKEEKKLLWNGNEHFTGITDFFKFVESKKYKIQYKYMLSRYSGKTVCPACEGSRLRKETNFVKLGGKTISELLDMSVTALKEFFNTLKLDKYDTKVAQRAIKEICSRLGYIEDVGLGYLTLSRQTKTLSGGESQRINLVSSLGSSLVGSLYILDEPSIGLHHKDTQKLIEVIKKLRDLGNTVVIVEHDKEIILSADKLIDIGPLAGVHGGEVVYEGEVEKGIEQATTNATKSKGNNYSSGSLTIDYLSGLKQMERYPTKRKWSKSIEIKGAMEHNLKNVSVKFPLGVITAITGVSGSGKSSLISDTLYPALARVLQQHCETKPGAFKELSGDLSSISSVEFVDQNPIGKSSRSNPVTYLKIYDDIRKLFCDQQFAKVNGFGPSHFSFNVDGGRCPQCLGDGYITIPMQFMADVILECEHCKGQRYKEEALEIKYREKSIAEVLDMTIEEAYDFFSQDASNLCRRISQKIYSLIKVGLGYLKLGQSSATLSGGEAQRVKLAYFLSKGSNEKKTIFIFDEPSTGLHFYDILKLNECFDELVNLGHTVVVIEHNLDIIKTADWLIELGPGGGKKGGNIIFEGKPKSLLQEDTPTSKYLKDKF